MRRTVRGVVLLIILLMSSGMSLEIWKESRAGAVRRLAGARAGIYAMAVGPMMRA
jgi:hypothetical protein